MKLHNTERRWRGVLVAVAAAIVLTGVVGGAAGGTSGGTATLPVLRFGYGIGDILSLNPGKYGSAAGINGQFCDLSYGGLFHMTPKGTFEPEIAIKWRYIKTSRGPNKGFEFTIRKDARFPDGTTMTASTIVNWLNWFYKSGAGFNTYFGTDPEFRAVNRWTVRILLRVTVPDIPRILADNGYHWGCVPSAAAQANQDLMATGTYGAGPYTIDPAQSVKGDHYTFVPNPNYYNKKAIKFSQIVVKIILSPSSMLQALQAGQLDVVWGDISTVQAAESANFGVASAFSQSIVLNTNVLVSKELKDVRVRQAINYAMDRKGVVSALFGKWGKPTSEIITSDANPGLENYYAYNPTKAKQLLTAAGYPNGITLNLLSFAIPGPAYDTLVQAYAKNWEAVGIKMNIKPVSTAEWVRSYRDTDLYQAGVTINTTPSRWGLILAPNAAYNTWGGDGQAYKLYYQAFKQKDPVPTWKKFWKRMTEQAYFVPLAAYAQVLFFNNHITGVPASMNAGRPSTPFLTEWGYK